MMFFRKREKKSENNIMENNIYRIFNSNGG